MPTLLRFAGALLISLSLSIPAATAEAPAGPEGSAPDRVLLEQMLTASRVDDPDTRARLSAAFAREIDALSAMFGKGRPTYRKARRIHNVLHRRYLTHYDDSADGLQEILDGGRFNCLSASLFYALVTRAAGYPTQVVEMPGHVFVRLRIGKWTVDVETTSARGFDVDRRLESYAAGYLGDSDDFRWLRLSTTERNDDTDDSMWPVSVEQAVGFAWLNTAWRLLDEDPEAAARSVLEARRFLPDLATRAKGAERLLVRAFQAEYEGGRFERAFRISRAALSLHPDKTTVRDRLMAASVKRIEELSEAGRPAEAERLLDEAAATSLPAVELARLERGSCPLIAAAAVRAGDWALARRAARRFAAADADPVEAARLATWVEQRGRAGSSGGLQACTEGPAILALPVVSR